MKRLDIAQLVTQLDGTPYIKEFGDAGKPVHWTIRTLLIDTIQSVAMLGTDDAVLIWDIGLRLVGYTKKTIDIEDTPFNKLRAAYKHPQALLTKENWVKANIGKALETAEDINPDEKPAE